jgi:hypothetical protein
MTKSNCTVIKEEEAFDPDTNDSIDITMTDNVNTDKAMPEFPVELLDSKLEIIIYNNLRSNDCKLTVDQQTRIFNILKTVKIADELSDDFNDGINNKKPIYVIIPRIVKKLYSIFMMNADVVVTTDDLFDYIRFILFCIINSPLIPIGEFGKDILEDLVDMSIDLLVIQIPVITEEIYEEFERCKSFKCFNRYFGCLFKQKKTKITNRLSNTMINKDLSK